MPQPTIFSFLNAINYKKTDIKYDPKLGSAYLLMLWLSHDRTLLAILNKINQYIFNLPDNVVYNYLYDKIPRGKRFLKWVRKIQTDQEKNIEKELEEYKLSKKEIMLYNKFIK